jgi:sulfopropanediol 3-dehydrogenase
MQLDDSNSSNVIGSFETLKAPAVGGVAQRLPAVVERVTEMLAAIEAGGIDVVLKFARDLDGFQGDSLEISAKDLAATGDALAPELREALVEGSERTRQFALAQLSRLTDFEIEIRPGTWLGQKYIPVARVGAYLPSGTFPILASAFMTVGVPKAAGVPRVIACTPPLHGSIGNPAVLYSAYLSGVDQAYAVGGVQALAAMAFGLLGEQPVDMLVGAGNAYVTEAKRQLFGRVGIDLLAGPSEVAVIADETADPAIVAADLLGQAEHGLLSPASLVTTSRELGLAVIEEVERQVPTLSTHDICGPAWRDHGTVYYAENREVAAQIMDILAPEHLEIQTSDDDWYLERLTNYGSLFLGPWSTVAYSDKGITGTNHVLPTGYSARYSAGLSVGRFVRPLTFQRLDRSATVAHAPFVETISAYEGMSAHGATATRRLALLSDGVREAARATS